MTRKHDQKPPAHLSASTRKWWKTVAETYELEAQHLYMLTAAAEAWDRLQDARQAIARDGTTYTDRFGAPRPRPEVAIERDSRAAFCRLVSAMHLEDPPTEPQGGF